VRASLVAAVKVGSRGGKSRLCAAHHSPHCSYGVHLHPAPSEPRSLDELLPNGDAADDRSPDPVYLGESCGLTSALAGAP
jgi:hypothetical protein